ncbi:MAG: hypothetical protein A3I44_03545 [Candidatus Sungbacteria bacterium RIFCSPLOWO2_02_FULL_51_17]|uniref:O-antigen ligase-related domain-containing protein n=1 Tax=Candidatus Sungbacteria bacterium RIFCSPHIGHO2_02_FULL_51_29 TaxID=1802273 RepID=A0A1G2KRN8_9BACT|nr:MAG: hypothetical protein A3C16_04825 [Candidatus Sungbacteria bacterium RIFCSPHIGHO2_02_FULL_51_29]OHA06145.1 MAG: hypothetical protein A3B29_01755 [Candidatus Sungbacteria bacterium RIFCSPLOWO2_01_FULL_51_34]OHA10463.1 MAG: hypothetical protein A3I44_03545 [Candidatus Sungbacteria bacterium RIFCSPLOWO2_02_FULL_51_17]
MTYLGLKTAYLWAIKGLLFVVPFLPLYISSSMLFPFITGRNFTFRILVEAAFFLWMALAALAPEYRPKLTKLNSAVFAFIVIVFTADLLGVHIGRSFWSNYERMEGFWTIVHVVMYYFVLAGVFKTRKDWLVFFNLMCAGAFLVGIYAFFQRLGYFISIQGGARVDGTIGNPAYLAAYLLLACIIVGIVAFRVSNFRLRLAYGALAAFFLLVMYLSATRGAALALFVAALLFGVLYIVGVRAASARGRTIKAAIGAGLLLVVLAPFLLYQARDWAWVKADPALSRFANISLQEKTVRSRFMIWGIAWQGVKARPILGWGQENFNIVFARYFDPRLYDQEPWFDRAHNIVFDWMIHTGILGLLSYLSLFAAALHLLWKRWRADRAHPYEPIIIGVGLVAYFLQNIFVFDNLNTYMLFFAVLAYVNGFDVGGSFDAGIPQEARTKNDRLEAYATQARRIPRSLSVFVAGAVVFLIAAYAVNIKPILQGRALISALRVQAQNAPITIAREYFNTALAYNTPTGTSEVREQLAQSAYRYFENKDMKEEDRREYALFAIGEIEKQVRDQPLDMKYLQFIASLYISFASIDQTYPAKAEAALLKATEMSPTKQQTYYTLAQLYMNMGQMDKAVDVGRNVVLLEPANVEAQTVFVMLTILSGKGDLDAALAELERAIDSSDRGDYHRFNTYPRIIAALGPKKDYVRIITLYERLILLNPDNPQYHASIGTAYYAIGKKDDARAQVREAIRLDPTNYRDQGEQFLKIIDAGGPLP